MVLLMAEGQKQPVVGTETEVIYTEEGKRTNIVVWASEPCFEVRFGELISRIALESAEARTSSDVEALHFTRTNQFSV